MSQLLISIVRLQHFGGTFLRFLFINLIFYSYSKPKLLAKFEFMSTNPQEILQIAIKAAIRGGRIIKQYWGDLESSQVESKSSWRDLVTVADKKSEEIILKTIKAKFPDHTIISEEGGGNKEITTEYKWAIDPLDGTTNFRHSYPFFCVSIGVL